MIVWRAKMERICVVEDEENIRELIKIALEGYGYQVEVFETAEEGLFYIKREKPDLILFDWMLPKMSGIDAVKEIRKDETIKKIPIILLTAREKELDKVVGLDSGADDYITKPFGVLELGARVRSLLRRTGISITTEQTILLGKITINLKTREVWFDKEKIELTLKEYNLLVYLIEHQDRIVPREELLNQIWGYEYDGETRTLDIHIRTLRQKLGEEGQEYIKTSRGVGYRISL